MEETILHGSVYEGIYSGFVTYVDVLKFLLEKKPKTPEERERYNIAYVTICNITHLQYVDGRHFIVLTDDIEYIGLYFLINHMRGGILEVNRDSLIVHKKCGDIQLKINNNQSYGHLYLMSENYPPNQIGEDKFSLCAKIRSRIYISKYSTRDNLMIDADWISHFTEIKSLKFLLKRGHILKSNAPLYWEKVMSSQYYKLLSEHVPKMHLSRKVQKKVKALFPDINIRETPGYICKISELNDVTKSYVLGFPIHEYIPGKSKIEERLKQLEELGIKKFVTLRAEEEKKQSEIYFNSRGLEPSNAEDTAYEPFEEYSSFDVVNHITDLSGNIRVFRFTRREFEKLVVEKKNFYTRENLPQNMLVEIKKRITFSAKNVLPQCKTLLDLLLSYADSTDMEKEGLVSENSPSPSASKEEGDDENNDDGDFEDEEDDDDDDLEDIEDLEEEDDDFEDNDFENNENSNVFYGKIKNMQSGEVVIFEFPIEAVPGLDPSELEDFLIEYFPEMGFEYLETINIRDVPRLLRNHRLFYLRKHHDCPECANGRVL